MIFDDFVDFVDFTGEISVRPAIFPQNNFRAVHISLLLGSQRVEILDIFGIGAPRPPRDVVFVAS